MWASTQQIIPDPAGSFDTGKDMSKPSENPRNNKDDEVDLSKALKDLFKLFILLNKQRKNHITDQSSQSAYIIGQKISKICFSCFFHQIISLIIPEQNNKDRSYIMKTLNVLQFFVFSKKTV